MHFGAFLIELFVEKYILLRDTNYPRCLAEWNYTILVTCYLEPVRRCVPGSCTHAVYWWGLQALADILQPNRYIHKNIYYILDKMSFLLVYQHQHLQTPQQDSEKRLSNML